MTKKNYLLLITAATCLQLLLFQLSFSQKLPSTLLWKISGNGFEKPSYLYGTMHLTDERIFNLGDSLYKAIEHSDGFAIEIDPAEFTPFVIDETKKNIYQNTVPLKETMGRDNFKKYGSLLAKKLHKKADELTTGDVLHEKNKWIEESFSTGKMQTFLDAYLFDIARREGKWTGGVEDLKDQEGLEDMIDESDIEQLAMSGDDKEMKKENDSYTEYLINAYIKNDLNAINEITNQGDSAFEDAILFKRNKKMAMRMDSLGHQRSMVFAVGAAHLPGDKGLIALLKEKGFTVTPVFSSKKIKPADYKVAEVPLKWFDVKDQEDLYTASMPGKPGDITLYGIMNMKMYFDVFSSTIYMTTAMKTPYSQKMADSVFSTMAAYYFGVSDYSKGKPIILNNVPGREFVSKKENFSHGYLLFKNGTMYIALGVSTKKGSANEVAINRFLHSLTLFENVKNDSKSFTYINKIKAFQVDLPGPAKSGAEYLSAVTKDSSIRQELNISSDPESGAYFLFGTNEASPGYTLENDSLILATIGESQKPKFKKMLIDTMYVKNGGRSLDIGGMMVQAPLMLKARYQFRGNRWYGLVAIYDTAKDVASVQKFFNSFTTIDYAHEQWNKYASPDNTFSTWAPIPFNYKGNLTGNDGDAMCKYESYDSSRGDNYGVVVQDFSKYYWQKSDSALWNELIKRHQINDSLLSKKAIANGGVKGYELELQQNGSSNIKRLRIFLNNGKLYNLMTLQLAGEINNGNNNQFFDSFRFSDVHPDTNLLVSKAALLLSDVSSPDSEVSSKAVRYLSFSPFTKKDLPLLHEALMKHYSTGQDYYDDQTKNKLKNIIVDLKDSSSFNFAKNNYAVADDTTKNMLLSIMASFHTKEYYN
ncbi:MAG: TraB/GumN family protein, partial [Ginsengibacter sp.]